MFRKQRTAIAWMLAVVMALSPLAAYAQAPVGQVSNLPKAGGAKLDLGYLTPETVAAAVAFPHRVLASPEMEMLPIEVISAAGMKELGIDPVEIEQVLAMVEPPTALGPEGGPPAAGIVLRVASPLGQGKILPQLWERTTEGSTAGAAYRKGKSPMDLSIYQPDDRTLVLAHDALLQKMVANHAAPKPGPMSAMLGRVAEPPDVMAVLLVKPLRPLIAGPLSEAPLPPPLAGLKKVPELINYIAVKANVRGDMAGSLIVRAESEAAAETLEQIIDAGMEIARQAMMAEMAKQAASKDPVEQAMAKYAKRVSGRMFEAVRPVRKGDTLTLGAGGKQNSQMASVATIGILVALLLPAVQAAREAARRTQSANNLRQIAVAMMSYEAARGVLPARANFDKQGKPLLSWRVHMLPYLEQEALYKQFHLDEPWDSENNKKLIPLMPAVYRNPSSAAQPGMANYLAVVGKGLAFEGERGRKMADFRDGTSNTILLVEAGDSKAAIWTKPDDWEPDFKHPLPAANAHPGGFSAMFADGHVQFISRTIDPAVFEAMLTIAGGEAVRR
jgi:prepilin-type processing-associated H-X9-DG protein